MAGARKRTHKHFQLDGAKLTRAQTILRARTQTETIELALDLVITEHRRNRIVAEASERFVRSGVDIKDVYGKLAD
jgi:hypothetical protein